MYTKLALVALFALFAWGNADEINEEAANLTSWYGEHVDLYEASTFQSRVIGGQPAQRRQLPWHVLISVESGAPNSWVVSTRFCAGSLISSHFVLSEANALRAGNRYECLLGAHNRDDRRVVRRSNRAIFHPDSRPGQGNWNVAILELERAFTDFTKDVRPILLAAADADYQGNYGWVSGFGSSSKLICLNLIKNPPTRTGIDWIYNFLALL